MSNVLRDMVDGIGITSFNDLPANPLYFTQICVPETVKLPNEKPDIEDLVSVMVDAKVISVRLINTPVSTSREGQILTGRKLIVELKLKQKVTYVAEEPSQSIHAAHFEKLVSSIFVVVPPVIGTIPIETLFNRNRILITPYIEDIYGKKIDKRTIFKNITILLNVTFK